MTRRKKPEAPKTDVDLLRMGMQGMVKKKPLPERFEVESVPGAAQMRFKDTQTGNVVDIGLCDSHGAVNILNAFFTPGMKSRMVDVETCSNWALVCVVNWGSAKHDLPPDIEKELMDKSWAMQDGYGEVGYTPPQGWDWSGIRDSTDEAQRNIAEMLRKELLARNIRHIHLTMHDYVQWDE